MTVQEREDLIRQRMKLAVRMNHTDAGEIAWKLGLPRDYVKTYLYAGIPHTAALLAEIILGLGVSSSWLLGLSDRREN